MDASAGEVEEMEETASTGSPSSSQCTPASAGSAQPPAPSPTLGSPPLGSPTLGSPTLGSPTLGSPPLGNPPLGSPGQTNNTMCPTTKHGDEPGNIDTDLGAANPDPSASSPADGDSPSNHNYQCPPTPNNNNNNNNNNQSHPEDLRPADPHPEDPQQQGQPHIGQEAEGGDSADASRSTEVVDFKVVYNKRKFDVTFPPDETVGRLKIHLQSVIGIPPAMQKVMVKGLARDERTLRELGVSAGTKLLVVGSTLDDVLSVSASSSQELASEEGPSAPTKEPLCQQKMHRKILDKGVPEDAMPGIRSPKESLPAYPLTGMVNKGGGKVRLTFKLEQDQLWIGTKERTDKLPMSSIKNVISEPITGNEEYHILGIQLGPTEASRYWVYWVPAQYVDAIKDSILGKWQYF